MAKYVHLKISKLVSETSDSLSVYFKKPLFSRLTYKSGQFLTFVFMVNGTETFRSYSLNSAPDIDDHYSITVKRVEGGLLSNYVLDNLKVGQKMVVKKPMGNFVITPQNNNKRHVILFGAGSGITPLYSIAKTILHKELGSKVTLVYGNRNEHSIIFREKLNDLQDYFEGRFHVHHLISRPLNGWAGQVGRLEHHRISGILDTVKRPELTKTEYYICGPDGMMAQVEQGLMESGVSAGSIYKESFGATPQVDTRFNQKLDFGPQTIRIKVGREYHGLHIPANTTILNAALQNKLKVPSACCSGVCATCLCKVKNGEVEMVGEHCLSDKDVKKGYVLACISYPKSQEVLIEVD